MGPYPHSVMCLHVVAWLKTGTILPFHQFSIYIIYLFTACLSKMAEAQTHRIEDD